jgi:predicted ATPase
MIGLTGAHRTGKTTLAKAFAEERGIPFLQTSASQVFKEIGLNPAVEYPFEVRLDVQERILQAFAEQYRSMGGKMFITDRTPIDMMAYTLAEVRANNLTPELSKRLDKYLSSCVKLTNEIFAILVIVQPGIQVVAEEGKASLEGMYIEHIANLVMGITASEVIHASHFFVPRRTLSLEKRVKCVESAVDRTLDRHKNRIQAAIDAGSPIVFH